MKFRLALLMLLLQAYAALGQTTPPVPPPTPPTPPPDTTIFIPTVVPETPPPLPSTTPMQLTPDLIYVIASNSPITVLDSRQGYVKLVPETGPVKMKGKFVDAPTVSQTRTYTQKYLVSVEAVGTGPVELLIFLTGETNTTNVQRRLLDVAMNPIPPPPPTPVDPPTPIIPIPPIPTPPTPIPSSDFRVLGLYERDTLTTEQASVMNNQVVRDWLKANTAKMADGSSGFRFFDKDAALLKESQMVQDMAAAAKAQGGTLPVIVVFNGTKGKAYPVPATGADLLTLLQNAKAGK